MRYKVCVRKKSPYLKLAHYQFVTAMMIDVNVLLGFAITVTTFLILPGPVNLVIVNATIRFGLKGAFWSIVGTNTASLVLISLATAMLSGFSFFSPKILTILTIVGGFYLLYFAYDLYMSARQCQSVNHGSLDKNSLIQARPPILELLSKGFLVGVSNPKDVIFFLSFFPPFIGKLGLGLLPSVLVLTLLWCVLDYVLLFAYALGVLKFVTPKIEKNIMYICAILFVVLGFYAITINIQQLYIQSH